jgi:hypothetical protein
VTTVLVDRDVEGQAALLWAMLASEGWLDLVPMRFVTLIEVGLAVDSPDRVVWQFAQAHTMLLLTNNRNAKGEDSLGQTIRDEGTPESLPVLTIATRGRIVEREYRQRCAERLVEIVLDLERNLGVGRIYIP